MFQVWEFVDESKDYTWKVTSFKTFLDAKRAVKESRNLAEVRIVDEKENLVAIITSFELES